MKKAILVLNTKYNKKKEIDNDLKKLEDNKKKFIEEKNKFEKSKKNFLKKQIYLKNEEKKFIKKKKKFQTYFYNKKKEIMDICIKKNLDYKEFDDLKIEEIKDENDTIEEEIEFLINNGLKFNILVIDPSWDYNQDENCSYTGIASKHYPPICDGKLARLKIKEILEKDCLVFIWVI